MSNQKLKQLFREILDENESLSLDSKEDRDKLLNKLVEPFQVNGYDDVVNIAEAIFLNGQVDELMMSCELIIKTGLSNVAAASDEPVLTEITQAVSPEFFHDEPITEPNAIIWNVPGLTKED